MERTDLVLSEINQSQKDKYQVSVLYVFSLDVTGSQWLTVLNAWLLMGFGKVTGLRNT